MKRMIFLASAFALSVVGASAAQAKLTPRDIVPSAPSLIADESVTFAGPIGAVLEADYFRAPQANYGGARWCGLQPYFSHQPIRLLRSCD